jgi:TPR repeat protein
VQDTFWRRGLKVVLVLAIWISMMLGVLQPALGQGREPAASEKRFALVIGNSRYTSSPLKNPVNDARAMATTLRSLGFDVSRLENASYKDMRRAIIEFGNRLRDSGVGVFYYAGHGLQVNGRNYMVPVDAVIQGDAEVAVEAVDVDYVLSRMETARNRLNIVILDACRDDPFSRSFRSPVHGLASIDAPIGTLIAYATAPGKVAQDGEGPNGLYTSELLKAMKVPGLKIEDVFKRVRQSVSKQTNGQQVPWEASSLIGDFLFTVVPGGASTASPVVAPRREEPERSVGSQSASVRSDDLEQANRYIKSKNWASALPVLQESARKGSAEAMWLLGNLYSAGLGVPRDQAEAVRWYLKAGENGSFSAMASLGYVYQNGLGVPKDQAEAVRWYRKGADGGNEVAMNDLGLAYLNGWGVAKDQVEALRWFRRSADAGGVVAMRNLGYLHHSGIGVAKDDAESARWYQKGADAGDAESARNLGVIYQNGVGVPVDQVEALRWYRKGADGGNAEAANSVGISYQNGWGVAKDEAEALRWFRKAADGGSNMAMGNLGMAYLKGMGVKKDEAEAVLWYRKSAEAGNSTAMNDLGAVYANGWGVPKDEAEAVRWYQKAAEAGLPLAMRNLAFMYASGYGVAKDEAEAVSWMRKSADGGDIDAMRVLGTMYQNGVGVAADQAEAIKWYKRAASLGDRASIERLNALRKD